MSTSWRFPSNQKRRSPAVRRNPKMFVVLRALPVLFFFLLANRACAQAAPICGCEEIPGKDALSTVCVPPSSETAAPSVPDSVILLQVPAGTALRVAIDQKVRIARVGQVVSG